MAISQQHNTDPAICQIDDFLSRGRIALDLNVSSKKRLFEEMAAILVKDSPALNKDTVFQVLIERERLGSTGIGHGIALPHGRVSGMEAPVMAAARLKRPLEFEAIDNQPVQFIIALLVPADATSVHLQLLARLAERFNDAGVRARLGNAISVDELYDALTDGHGPG